MDWPIIAIVVGMAGLAVCLPLWLYQSRQHRKLERFQRRMSNVKLVRRPDQSLADYVYKAHRSAAPIFGGPHPDVMAFEDLQEPAAALSHTVRTSKNQVSGLSDEEHLAAALVVMTLEEHQHRQPLDIDHVGDMFAVIIAGRVADNATIARAYALIYGAASPAPHP